MTDRRSAIPMIAAAAVMLLAVLIGAYLKPVRYDRSLGTEPTRYRIDPNTADADTLCLLPGVGPGIAQHIVNHRNTQGPFRNPQDLERVRFVGPKTRAAIEPWVVFDRPSHPH